MPSPDDFKLSFNMSHLNALTHFFYTSSIAATPSSVPKTPEASPNASSDPPYPSHAHNFTAARDDTSQPAVDDQANPHGDEDDWTDDSISDMDRHPGSESGSETNDDAASDNNATSSSNTNNNHLEPLLAQNNKGLTHITFTLPDLINRSNQGELFNIIPKPEGTGGHNFNIQMQVGLKNHKGQYRDMMVFHIPLSSIIY